jgi:hypothetical protein
MQKQGLCRIKAPLRDSCLEEDGTPIGDRHLEPIFNCKNKEAKLNKSIYLMITNDYC